MRLPSITQTNQIGEIKVYHATGLDKLIERLQDIKRQGGALLRIRQLDLSRLVCLTCFDASFAQGPGLKSQCGMLAVLTDCDVKKMPVIGYLVEYESSTIQRVVGSTMAAESAAFSKSLDRQLYLRLVVETVLYGQPFFEEQGLASRTADPRNPCDRRQEPVRQPAEGWVDAG